MPKAPEVICKLKAEHFSLRIELVSHSGQTHHLKAIDISAGLIDSTFIIKGFLVNFRAIRLDVEGIKFAFSVEVSLISNTITSDISEITKIPTVSVVDGVGDWSLVIADDKDDRSVGRCVVRKVP